MYLMKDLYSEYKNHSYDSRRKLEPQLKKIGKSFEQTFYQRRYMNGQQMQKKMLNAFDPRKMRC